MNEFGHVFSNHAGVCIDAWGGGPFIITANGKPFRFEDSDRFGPLILTKQDMPSEGQPREGHPFWRAHRIWVRQWRRVLEDKITCVWDEPKPKIVKRLNRRNVLVLEEGDEDGVMVFADALDRAKPKGEAE